MPKDGCWSPKDRQEVLSYLKDDLWRYLFNQALPQIKCGIENLFDLSEEDIQYLKTVHFLLSPQIEELLDSLPKLMRNLSHSTQKEIVECRGVIRGRIDWNLTYKQRYSQGFNDPSLFMCKPASKMYDLPENQLLKFILEKIIILTDDISVNLSEETFPPETIEKWRDILFKNYFEIKKSSKNVYFQYISTPKYIKPKTVQRAIKHRNRLYESVANCYELYDKLFIKDDFETLINLVQEQILEPLNNDQLYEIYVFFQILNSFDEDGELELGLLRPNSDYSAKYNGPEGKIRVYYQLVPTEFKQNSKFKEIFDSYNLNVSSRRPDVILEFEQDGKKIYRIIEVKRTDNRDYIVESAYKVLAYLSDFDKCEFAEDVPSILVTWGGVKIKDKNKVLDHPVLILNKNELSNLSKKLLYPHLTLP